MTCPLCAQRKAKRRCPALDREICPVCCGTKRLVEIRCPAACPYLKAADRHPPAVVQRRQQEDVGALFPTLAGLSDRQGRFFFLFVSVVARHEAEPLRPLKDTDVADGAAALAKTLETAARGVIYHQTPQSVPAQRLVAELRNAFERAAEALEAPRSALERDAATALAALERGARELPSRLGSAPDAYLQLLKRVIRPGASNLVPPGLPETGSTPESGLIIP